MLLVTEKLFFSFVHGFFVKIIDICEKKNYFIVNTTNNKKKRCKWKT